MGHVTTESVRKAYQFYAHYYDLIFGRIFHPGRHKLLRLLNLQKGQRVLEVGVGTGLSLPLYPSGVSVVGIDLSESMLSKAHARLKSHPPLAHVEELRCLDAQEMDFPDKSFDIVVAMYVASVVPNPEKLVKEMRRVCKPNGKLAFLNHFESTHKGIRIVEHLLSPLAKYLGFHPSFPLSNFLTQTQLNPTALIPANLFNYWTILLADHKKEPLKKS